MPLYCLGVVRGRNLHAAFEPMGRDREVQHVGRDHTVVHDVGALRRHAVDERGRKSGRGQPHVATDRDTACLEVRDESGADRTRTLFVDLRGINAAHVVRFEDIGVEFHGAARLHLRAPFGRLKLRVPVCGATACCNR
jgi:hypothetical protein